MTEQARAPYAEDISFVCGDPLFEDELEDEMLLKLKETFFVKEARSCTDWVERDFFNTGGVKGRIEFEYICSICGAPPEDSPLVADAVLGLRDAREGRKLLPCKEVLSETSSRSNKGNMNRTRWGFIDGVRRAVNCFVIKATFFGHSFFCCANVVSFGKSAAPERIRHTPLTSTSSSEIQPAKPNSQQRTHL